MLIHFWHSFLDMARKERAWHVERMMEEVEELKHARGFVMTWSEISDVVYDYTRARWGGYRDIQFPLPRWKFFVGVLYMIPKYTLRWLFFYTAGRRAGAKVPVHAVQNPRKEEKLRKIAVRNKLEPERFVRECRRLMRWWPLLP